MTTLLINVVGMTDPLAGDTADRCLKYLGNLRLIDVAALFETDLGLRDLNRQKLHVFEFTI